jgi:hypothetical protein
MTDTFAHNDRSERLAALAPAAAAVLGAVLYGLAMTAGDVFDLNADGPDAPQVSTGEMVTYVAIVLTAVVVAVGLARWAQAGSPTRLERTALGLAVGALVTVIAFWSGWPLVLGAVAAVLAVDHRRRVGSFSTTAGVALGLGLLALVTSTYLCLTG